MTHHCDDPHCHDPHCDGHHHAHGEAPERASVFAVQRAFLPAAPVPRAKLEESAFALFCGIGESCCVDGILPGHAKGLVETAEGALSLSLTCADRIDADMLGGWAALDTVSAFTVTLNIHLVIPRTFDAEALFAPFTAL